MITMGIVTAGCVCILLLSTAFLLAVHGAKLLRAMSRCRQDEEQERERQRRAAKTRKELENFMSYDGSEQG